MTGAFVNYPTLFDPGWSTTAWTYNYAAGRWNSWPGSDSVTDYLAIMQSLRANEMATMLVSKTRLLKKAHKAEK